MMIAPRVLLGPPAAPPPPKALVGEQQAVRLWNISLATPAIPPTLVGDNSSFIMTVGGELVLFNASDGRQLWRRRLGQSLCYPRVVGDRVLVQDRPELAANANRTLFCVSASRGGEVLWTYRSAGVWSTDVSRDRNTVILGGVTGR